MDAVELPFPVGVAALKIMGSEGFGFNGAEVCESESVPVLVARSVGRKEKNHLVKQKNHVNSKKSEKRNPKVPPKSKHDTFPFKANFNTASGGSSLFRVYGLKSDTHDVTKLIDDSSLIGLLDGTSEAPKLGKNTGKKEQVTSGTLLHSVRKAGSVLQLHSSSADKNRDPHTKTETPIDVLDHPLYQPKDVLERLALPPPKDLNSLLQDADKPTVSSRHTLHVRPGKQIACRASLPAFPWSCNFMGQSRSNADMIKLSSSKNPCYGRWRRVAKTAGDFRVSSNCFSNLDSLKYGGNLVPSERLKPCTLHWSQIEEDCPRILSAAQTLMDMATTVRQKRASQKIPRAHKSLSLLRCENVSRSVDQACPSKKPKLSTAEKRNGSMNWPTVSETRHSSTPGRVSGKSYKCEHIMGHFLMETQNGQRHSKAQTKRARALDKGEKKLNALMNWHYGGINSVAEPRHCSSHIMKQSSLMPPPSVVSGKFSEAREKRKACDKMM